jgi:hypothetical protein
VFVICVFFAGYGVRGFLEPETNVAVAGVCNADERTEFIRQCAGPPPKYDGQNGKYLFEWYDRQEGCGNTWDKQHLPPDRYRDIRSLLIRTWETPFDSFYDNYYNWLSTHWNEIKTIMEGEQ